MSNKKAPLHAIEVALYKAAQIAKKDGFKRIILGSGADTAFGGLDGLLSKEWSFGEFVRRYNFIVAEDVLVTPASMLGIYEKYRVGKGLPTLYLDVLEIKLRRRRPWP